MRETTFPFVWRIAPLIWVWVQQDLKAAGLDLQPKEGLVTGWTLGGGEAHIVLLSSCLVPCSGCSPCTWACSQCIPQQRGLTVQFFYARAGKNVGAKGSSPVSSMALLTRFGIHFRKEFSAIFIHFPSGCISKSQLEFESPRARLFLAGSLFSWRKKEANSGDVLWRDTMVYAMLLAPPHLLKGLQNISIIIALEADKREGWRERSEAFFLFFLSL